MAESETPYSDTDYFDERALWRRREAGIGKELLRQGVELDVSRCQARQELNLAGPANTDALWGGVADRIGRDVSERDHWLRMDRGGGPMRLNDRIDPRSQSIGLNELLAARLRTGGNNGFPFCDYDRMFKLCRAVFSAANERPPILCFRHISASG